ncbi:LysR substrate-binding domain-containing protein [Pseudomonadota bacterium AL_CKDN230030165-1A_HGKHYDSX7]
MKTDLASELDFFVRVARLGSLSGAARELDLSPAAATKRLAGMEDRLGVRLLNRSTRSISLTNEGETYLRHATRILADLREMEEAVSSAGTEPRGLLRVNATLGFGRTVIAPLVSAFGKRYPHVDVQLDVTDRPVDLVEGGIDLAIRFGSLPDRRLRARRILSNRRLLCASPAYLKRHGEPASLADLAGHRCIIHRQNDEAHGVWRFEHAGTTEVIKVSGALSSNDGDIVLGWALDGHGILIRSEWDLAKYLESGRLRVLLPDYTLPSADLYVYYPQRRSQTARARMFIDFLVEHLETPPKRG